MSRSRSLSSRIAAVTVALSVAALPIASAEAARGSRGEAIQQAVNSRTIVGVLMGSLLSIFDKTGSHPGNRPGNGTSEAKPEGSGVCPNGKPGPQGNPNQTGA